MKGLEMVNIFYKSFHWSLGTTSFRTLNLNKTIEEQLFLLHEFWNLEQNQGVVWNGNSLLQAQYYDFMKTRGFLSGDVKNKPKDAREKTSGLVDIGLIDEGRKLTEAGRKLLEISQNNNFTSENILQIPSDSFVYLKQLLKTTCKVNGFQVRPMIVLLYLLNRVEHLTLEEFTFLLPLCTNAENTEYITNQIPALRAKQISIDEIIVNRLMNMENYRAARELFLNETVKEDLICTIGLNRKSREYDRPYFRLFQELHKVFLEKNLTSILSLYKATKEINIGIWWRDFLFDTASKSAIQAKPSEHLRENAFSRVETEQKFRETFFKHLHLFKAKATLRDYLDLNRRYFKTSDVFLFEDGLVRLDIVPKYFFKSAISELYKLAFTPCENLPREVSLEEISPALSIDESIIVQGINSESPTPIHSLKDANQFLDSLRYKRLNHLIETQFSDEQLLHLLDLLATRQDDKINDLVTDCADIPTIFEYVLGILWYKVSEFKGKVLTYMKLSLDANLLPKTHAGGGEADIVYEYEKTDIYPAHTLLLEASIVDSTIQRRTVMEPVPRHLGIHILQSKNLNSYSVFVGNKLDINVVSDFQSRKNFLFYDSQDYTRFVIGMKIIPLQISDLKEILIHKTKYKDLYPIFAEAHAASCPPHIWYTQYIQQKLQ